MFDIVHCQNILLPTLPGASSNCSSLSHLNKSVPTIGQSLFVKLFVALSYCAITLDESLCNGCAPPEEEWFVLEAPHMATDIVDSCCEAFSSFSYSSFAHIGQS